MSILAVSSEALLRRWQGGDAAAGEVFYERYCKPIQRFFGRRVRDSNDVADLMQDTFEGCQKGKYRGTSSALAYLFGIADNVFKKHVRQRTRASISPLDDDLLAHAEAEFFDDPAYIMERVRSRRMMMKALRRIPRKYQLVHELSVWEGLMLAEIAAVLGKPESTIRSWQIEGRKVLLAKLIELSASPERWKSTTMPFSTWRRLCRVEAGYVPETSGA